MGLLGWSYTAVVMIECHAKCCATSGVLSTQHQGLPILSVNLQVCEINLINLYFSLQKGLGHVIKQVLSEKLSLKQMF